MDFGSQPAQGIADGLSEAVQLDEQTGHLIRRAHQRASSILLSEMEDEQLTPAQSFALSRLYERGKLSQNHLGRLAAMDPEALFKTWLPVGWQNVEALQRFFWSNVMGAGSSSRESDES